MRKTYSYPDPKDGRDKCGSDESPTYGEDCPALVNIAVQRSRESLIDHTDISCGVLWYAFESRLYEQETASQQAVLISPPREDWAQCEIERTHFHGVRR